MENEGRFVPTSNSAREERGEGEGLENRAFEYMLLILEGVFLVSFKISKRVLGGEPWDLFGN